MIERWLVAIRDHPERPPAVQRLVLQCLALRLDWRTGSGFASVAEVAEDADASEPTVRRATSWARRAGLLLQTRRGHRLGNGQVAATEWKLTQPLTGELLKPPQPLNGSASTAQQSDLNRSVETPHQESSTSKPSSSLCARARELLTEADPAVSERVTELIIAKIKTGGGRNVLAIIRKNIKDGDAPALIAEARRTASYGAISMPPVSELCGRCGDRGHTASECTA